MLFWLFLGSKLFSDMSHIFSIPGHLAVDNGPATSWQQESQTRTCTSEVVHNTRGFILFKTRWCPVCRSLLEHPVALSSSHVLQECVRVEGTWRSTILSTKFSSPPQSVYPGTRDQEGIGAFLTECEDAGRSLTTAHYLYVNGQIAEGIKISVQDHLRRGASLIRLTDAWLELWEFVNM